jgi:hypothetical protein
MNSNFGHVNLHRKLTMVSAKPREKRKRKRKKSM